MCLPTCPITCKIPSAEVVCGEVRLSSHMSYRYITQGLFALVAINMPDTAACAARDISSEVYQGGPHVLERLSSHNTSAITPKICEEIARLKTYKFINSNSRKTNHPCGREGRRVG